MNRPVTVEGRQVWGLAQQLGGQMRFVAGMGMAATGYDMTAALAAAEAQGIDRHAVAVLLPEIEAAAVAAMNARNSGGSDEGEGEE